jgi:acetyl esterase/lipase
LQAAQLHRKPTETVPKIITDLAFNQSRCLDIHCTEEPGRPLVVCLHGGGFVSGDRRDERCMQTASLLVRNGFNCATVSYSLAKPGDRFGQWPRNLFDLAQAVAFLHDGADRFGLNVNRFALLGFSAGCCLSNLYMQGGPRLFSEFGFETTVYRPAALVGFYGPYDFSIRQAERRSADPDTNRLHSPRYWLQRNEGKAPPPVLHIHGDRDEVVYFDQHEAFRDDCAENGYAFESIVAGDFGHSFAPRDTNDRGERIDLEADIVEFLGRHLLDGEG